MVSIVQRKKLADFLALYRDRQVDTVYVTLGRGTANGSVAGYFGLESPEKGITMAVVTDKMWAQLKADFINRLYINVPNTGVVFITPVASIGGKRELGYLLSGQEFAREQEESVLKNTENELLVVFANEGYSNLVMDAARGAGARGGTVIHGRGTGSEKAERFFGVSIASDKDIILIVTSTEDKKAIMGAIMEKAGMQSEAKAIVVSLPVTDTAGLKKFAPQPAPEQEAQQNEEAKS